MDRFDEIMVTVFKWEGGFVDHPHDNGGPTNMGITHAVLAQWRGVGGVTAAEVRALTREEATDIFRDRYWKKFKGDELPEPIDLVVMDGAVNHGVTTMVRMLQEVIGANVTGRISAANIEAVAAATNSQAGVIDLAVKLAERRKQRYVNHEDAIHFLPGWRNRLNDVMSVAFRSLPVSWTFKDGMTGAGGGGTGTGTDPMPPTTMVRPVIEDEDLQAALATAGLYHGDIDGLFGPKSSAALEAYLARRAALISGTWQSWPLPRRKIALGQFICRDLEIDVGRIDGLFGPRSEAGFIEFNRVKLGLPPDKWRDELDALPASGIVTVNNVWPTEADVPGFFGALGNECRSVPMRRLALPYPMRLAWDLNTTVTGFMIHTKAHDSAARVFDQFHRHYGEDGIRELGLDLFGGCFNCRRKSGGTSWSMHAWAIAIDFDPARNKLNWNHTRARLAKPDAVKFWEFWEAEGWLSLGRAKDFDWMHIQAARL